MHACATPRPKVSKYGILIITFVRLDPPCVSRYGQRREYTVMGPMVNLAARLMGKAAENGVLVDSETRKRTVNVAGIK